MQQLQQFHLQHLLPALNDAFNAWFGASDRFMTIDKLEVDIGHVNSSANSDIWLKKIMQAMEKKLRPVVIPHSQPEAIEIVHSTTVEATDYLGKSFLFFLENGRLPSASVYRSLAEVMSVINKLEVDQCRLLRAAIVAQKDPLVIARLAMLPTETLFLLVHIFLPQLSPMQWQEWLETGRKYWRDCVGPDDEKCLEIMAFPIFLQNTKKHLLQYLWSVDANEEISWNHLTKSIAAKWSEWQKKVAQNTTDEKEVVSKISDKSGYKPDEELVSNDECFVTNAGICLTVPYLPAFFRALALTAENMFIDTHAQQKAIHLLHYLATGEDNVSEEKLVLMKVLCGWPLQMPLLDEIILTDDEKNEAIDLLESMIAHWDALKRTSPDGLRQGFLQRSGKLSVKEEHFLLQVAHQSMDILLDYIPWQFRLIKLPWMKMHILVDWY